MISADKKQRLHRALDRALDAREGRAKDAGVGAPHTSILSALGFREGTTIKQSPTNQLTVWHGKGPGGTPQQVAVTPKTFSHVSNPATAQAVVHAKTQPIEGLKAHLIKHWTDHVMAAKDARAKDAELRPV